MRVVSLSPTQTEILAALGLGTQLCGITENCDYPKSIHGTPTFGSWYAPDLNRVMQVRPDLVCTFGKHQEEAGKVLIEAGLQVYHSDPPTVAAALATILDLANLTDQVILGRHIVKQLEGRMQTVRARIKARAPQKPPRVLRIMHWQPLITVGPGAFQHDVIHMAGGNNIMQDGPAPYFTCELEEVQRRDPEVVFFCEPEILRCMHQESGWNNVSAVRDDRIYVFDCGLTCRSGPRIVDMLELLVEVLHSLRSA